MYNKKMVKFKHSLLPLKFLEFKDIFVFLFFESHIGVVATWFQNSEDGCITNWVTLTDKFLATFKPSVDVGTLLCNFSRIHKEKDGNLLVFTKFSS